MKYSKLIGLATLLTLSMSAQSADIYYGEDLNPSGSIGPNSLAANTSFLSHLTGVGTEDFESFSDGDTGPFNINFSGAGTATLTTTSGSIRSSGAGRFATSGTEYLDTNTSFVIDFSQAISAFGFYGTDIGDFGGQITLDLLSGATTQYNVGNTTSAPNGAVLFWGIIDVSNPFTKITFGNTNSTDYFGFDDMTIGTQQQVVNAVPLPAAAFMFAPALLGFMGLRRKAKKTAV